MLRAATDPNGGQIASGLNPTVIEPLVASPGATILEAERQMRQMEEDLKRMETERLPRPRLDAAADQLIPSDTANVQTTPRTNQEKRTTNLRRSSPTLAPTPTPAQHIRQKCSTTSTVPANTVVSTVKATDGSTFDMTIHSGAHPDIVSSYIKSGRVWEPKIIKGITNILSKCGRSESVIDIGANIGYFTAHVGQLGHQVIAVEPFGLNTPLLMHTICQNGMRDRVQVFKAALLDAGEMDMCLWSTSKEKNTGNARLTPAFSGRKDFDANKGVECMETIKSLTLDHLLFDTEDGPHLTRRPMLVKIDIEGSETKAMMGASRLLSQEHAPCFIFFEHNTLATETTGVHPFEMFALLKRAGYKIYDVGKGNELLGVVGHDTFGGNLGEGDFRAELQNEIECDRCA
jgi:FkbM family methyltransferase